MAIESYRGMTPKIADNVFVHASATIIGDVEIDAAASVWPGVVIRGDVNSIRIGARSNVQDGSILHVTHPGGHSPAGATLSVGRDVTIGHAVILHGCRIHDECLIGMGSLVMDNAVLEPRVLLGAGSLVPEGRVLAGGWLYLGRPARQVRRLTEEELTYFAYQAANYARLAAEYRAAQSQ